MPGGPGRHRPFRRDSPEMGPGARRWAAAHPTALPPPPAPAPVCSVAQAPVPGLWANKCWGAGVGVPLGLHCPHPTPGKELRVAGSGVPAPPCTCAPPQPESMQATPGRADAGLAGGGPVSRGLGFQSEYTGTRHGAGPRGGGDQERDRAEPRGGPSAWPPQCVPRPVHRPSPVLPVPVAGSRLSDLIGLKTSSTPRAPTPLAVRDPRMPGAGTPHQGPQRVWP